MNVEHIEAQLSALNGQPVIVIHPSHGTISFSYSGILAVTTGNETHHVGFHLCNPMGVLAIIFFADDVVQVDDPPSNVPVKKIIRLRGPSNERILQPR